MALPVGSTALLANRRLLEDEPLTGVKSIFPSPTPTAPTGMQPALPTPGAPAPAPAISGILAGAPGPSLVNPIGSVGLLSRIQALQPQAPKPPTTPPSPAPAPPAGTALTGMLGGTPGPSPVRQMGQVPNLLTRPETAGGPLQEYGPGNDLRSTQINPYTGERLRGIQGDTDVLFRALSGGPSLTDAALEKFKLLGEQTAEQRGLGIRNIGQAAARLGRLGSGMVTTDLGNLEDVLRTREEQARRGLAADLAYGEGSERRANLGAAQSLEDQVYGQGRGARDEARGERAYQEDQARRAQDIDILRRQLEQQYEERLRQLGLQGAGLYGDQAAASSGAAASLLGGSF